MNHAMTSRERFLAAINQQDVDYMPTCGPFQACWALGESQITVAECIAKPELGAQAQLKVIQECDFDGLEVMWDWLSPAEALGCEIQMPELGAPITMGHVIDDHASLAKLQIPDIDRDDRLKSSAQSAQILIDQLGKERYLYCTAVAPFTLAGEIRGVENLMRDCFKNPSLVKDILQFTTEVLTGYYEYLTTLDVDGIFICDPTASGSLISRKVFDESAKPYISTIADLVKKTGKHAFIHICGDISDRLESILDIDHDVLSVDSYVDLEYAKSLTGEKVATLGNIDVANTLYMGTQQQVKDEILTCMKKTGGRGHILGGACDIAPESPMANMAIWKKVIRNNG
jgi:MtaA/CmuA family methyltransferase